MGYTTATAFFEAIWEAGITHCFVNLGSDHPAIMEQIARGKQDPSGKFPKIITCPHETVALSMADGFARLTGKPQCVIVHVDVGTQHLGAAVHNASVARCPVLIFAGLSPFTLEGELPGSRTEYIHWLQDVPDQKQIVSQYCRYTGEIKTGKNVKQVVNRALQFATSDPKGPVYLTAAREVLEESLTPYQLDQSVWGSIAPRPLPQEALETLALLLVTAKQPLLITGYSGRNHSAVPELVKLVDTVPGLRVIDSLGSDLCFPFSHPAFIGFRIGGDDNVRNADIIVVIDCDVPWIPTQCTPRADATIVHIDVDPLKQNIPLHYIPAKYRYCADSATAFKQLHSYISSHDTYSKQLTGEPYISRRNALVKSHSQKLDALAALAAPPSDETQPSHTSYLAALLRKSCPRDTIWCPEAVTNAIPICEQLQVDEPGHLVNGGGGGLGWSGGGTIGVKLASDFLAGGPNKGSFVCQIVGDGTFMFGVPSSVYWIAQKYNIPTLTIVLNNKGWNAPRNSLLLVHPEGVGSKVDNEGIGISFAPTPDYSGIAKAAAGHRAWAGCATSVKELNELLPQAVDSVKRGTLAVLEVRLKGQW
ncbi:thiamine pyrophosphate enzyme [Periconia macrospinosa]|uniref:Thiamine pyrophosphate enzyme n=1 Tax=Periconia macrospinosa TaxID=97972 RepID=A0A2V1DY17_9PLEO|nr:thiamine pyrophosphate enzyme [Periconia macrospinosa]